MKTKIKLNRKDYLQSLMSVSFLAKSNGTIPLLAFIKMEVKKDMVLLTTTDLSSEIRAVCKNDNFSIQEEFDICIPAWRMTKIVQAMKSDTISITFLKKEMIEIAGGNAKLVVSCLPTENFPTISDLKSNEFPNNILLHSYIFSQSINNVISAISDDDSRKSIQSLNFTVENGNVNLNGTDGKILAQSSINMELENKSNILINRKTVTELLKLLPKKTTNINVGFNKDIICFRFGNTVLLSKLVEGIFPNVANVIPKDFKTKIELNTEQFLSSLELVNIGDDDDNKIIITINNNEIILSCDNGNAIDRLPVEYNGDKIEVMFNINAMLELFRSYSHSDKVVMCYNDYGMPCKFEIDDSFYIVMPMRNRKNDKKS